ncbi:MAG: 3-phosphoshikimate 1-carboxyvinyltransferase [Chloroflexi bacterium]|nr:3-phosphoshikimate 1-carboxyvinyltransferase [Chloroflexota bacterium]
MDLIIKHATRLKGTVTVPGDRSICIRALLLASLAAGPTTISGWLESNDTHAALDCMQKLGVVAERGANGTLVIQGRGLHGLVEPEQILNCQSSGTTIRLMSGLMAGQSFLSILSGSAQLRARPMDRVTLPLRQMGAMVWGRAGDRLPPLALRGGDLHGMTYRMPVASAQVKSALLLAGLFAAGPTTVIEPASTRDHTERLMRAMGVEVHSAGSAITLHPPAGDLRSVGEMSIPGDISSAAFFLVAGIIVPQAQLTISQVGVNPTRTGIFDALTAMGASINLIAPHEIGGEPVADLAVRYTTLQAATFSGELIPRAIDEIPILAVAATQARGETIIRDAAELRVKESDRIAAISMELRKMGASIEELADGMVIHGPTSLRGARVHSHGDHRIAMSLAVAALVAQGETTIEDWESVEKTFPGFERLLARLT